MNLVNLEGTSIFGAGSEWFWSMAQFILVAASILGIYVQLRAQRASSLFDQTAAWGREWQEEGFMVNRLAALLDLEGRSVEAGLPLSSAPVGDFFERLGYLVAQGHLRSEDVWHSMRTAIGTWWTWMGPYLERTRQEADLPALYEWFEWLEREMRRLDVMTFGRVLRDEIHPSPSGAIDDMTRQLRLIADARNGVYPTRRAEADPPASA